MAVNLFDQIMDKQGSTIPQLPKIPGVPKIPGLPAVQSTPGVPGTATTSPVAPKAPTAKPAITPTSFLATKPVTPQPASSSAPPNPWDQVEKYRADQDAVAKTMNMNQIPTIDKNTDMENSAFKKHRRDLVRKNLTVQFNQLPKNDPRRQFGIESYIQREMHTDANKAMWDSDAFNAKVREAYAGGYTDAEKNQYAVVREPWEAPKDWLTAQQEQGYAKDPLQRRIDMSRMQGILDYMRPEQAQEDKTNTANLYLGTRVVKGVTLDSLIGHGYTDAHAQKVTGETSGQLFQSFAERATPKEIEFVRYTGAGLEGAAAMLPLSIGGKLVGGLMAPALAKLPGPVAHLIKAGAQKLVIPTFVAPFAIPLVGMVDASAQSRSPEYTAFRQGETIQKQQMEYANEFHKLNPQFTKEQATALSLSYTREQRILQMPNAENMTPAERTQAVFNMDMNDIEFGGHTADEVFQNDYYTPAQKSELLAAKVKFATAASLGPLEAGMAAVSDKAKLEYAERAFKNDPQLRNNIIAYAVDDMQRRKDPKYKAIPVKDEMTKSFITTVSNSFTQEEAQRIADGLKGSTVQEYVQVAQSYGNEKGGGNIKDAVIKNISERGTKDPKFAVDFAMTYMRKVSSNGVALSDTSKGYINQMLEDIDVDNMADVIPHKEMLELIAFTTNPNKEQSGYSIDGLKLDKFKTRFEGAVQTKIKNEIMANPFKGIPKAISLWLATKGFGKTAEAAADPWMFYGAALAVLGGGAWLLSSLTSGGGDDDEDDEDAPAKGRKTPPRYKFDNAYR